MTVPQKCEDVEDIIRSSKEEKVIETPICAQARCIEKIEKLSDSEIIGCLFEEKPRNKRCTICGNTAEQFLLIGHKWKGEK